MNSKSKSVLDNVPVEDKAFPLKKDQPHYGQAESWQPALEVVGHCPNCGSPIYGSPRIALNAVPQVKHSCECRNTPKPFADTIQAK